MPQPKRFTGRCHDCGHELPASQTSGTRCSTCAHARAERRPPLYRGLCVCGCGRPAGMTVVGDNGGRGGRSAMARVCYLRRHRRRLAFKRTMGRLCGVGLPADALRIALEQQLVVAAAQQAPTVEIRRALHSLVTLLKALDDGRLGIYRVAVGRATRRPAARTSVDGHPEGASSSAIGAR